MYQTGWAKILVSLWSSLKKCVLLELLFILMVASIQNVSAQESINLQAILKEMALAKKVTVVMTRPSRYTGSQQHSLTESFERYEGDNLSRLRVHGCGFANNDDESIQILVKSLQNNKTTSSDYHHLPYTRVNIYFLMEDDNEVRVSFGRPYHNDDKVDGEIKLPTLEATLKINVDHKIFRDIYQWVSSQAHYERLDTQSERWEMIKLNDPEFKQNALTCKMLAEPDYYQKQALQYLFPR